MASTSWCPSRLRGMALVREIARKGDFLAGPGDASSARFSQPLGTDLSFSTPDSMRSCASK